MFLGWPAVVTIPNYQGKCCASDDGRGTGRTRSARFRPFSGSSMQPGQKSRSMPRRASDGPAVRSDVSSSQEFGELGWNQRSIVSSLWAQPSIFAVMGQHSPTRNPGLSQVDLVEPIEFDRRGEIDRAELGRALLARSSDIEQFCQLKYVAQAPDMTFEMAARHPMWEIVSVAVEAIAEWLQTGTSAPDPARTHIASFGKAVAEDQERAIAERTSNRPAPPAPPADDGAVPNGALSVALVTKVNLWWKDITCRVLVEESGRLGVSEKICLDAIEMVDRSCSSSMVRMAKQYDLELLDLHARLLDLATHDQLTGLANRSVFLERLEVANAKVEPHLGLAVVFIDLDNFKSVNDGFGHGRGDELLKVVGERFTELMRPEDTIARFGGDEFVALFEDLADPAHEGAALAERLGLAVAEPIRLAGEPVFMTASIGVAVVCEAAFSAESVLAQADMAMYRGKRSGRNQVNVIEVTHESHSTALSMASDLHGALENRALELAFQPVFMAQAGDLVGFEAHCRWDHAERGAIPPLDFIPIAEESGLMPSIGAWVLEEACRQSVAWMETLGTDLSMAVNVSGRQLAIREFPALVARTLDATGLPAGALILEVTESILLGEHANYESVLKELSELGVRLSIDDFGTGFSSLAYLRRFPVDQLKVDRGFLRDVAEHGDTTIMGAVVGLAHDLGLEVVGEGVETQAEMATVQELGCDLMQGFLLG